MTESATKRTALVTGAARGIGRAIAVRLANDGFEVVVTDIDDDGGRATAEALGAAGVYRHLDVRREVDWVRVLDEIRDGPHGLHVLVNNAGITGFGEGVAIHDPENAELDDWRAVHETNLDGVFLGCKHGVRLMRASGQGSIVNISSRSGLVGIPAAAAYASSKAAVRNHTRTVALYCAEQNLRIRCNAVFPAAILTPLWEPMLGDGPDREERMEALVRDVPLRRWGTPEEVAHAVSFLASDGSAYMTGAEIVLDGGLLAGTAARPEP